MINKWPNYEEDEIFKVEEILKSGKVNYWTGTEGKLFEKEFGLKITNELVEKSYDLIVLAVSHRVFKKLDLKKLRKTPESIIYDIKGFYGKDEITHRL